MHSTSSVVQTPLSAQVTQNQNVANNPPQKGSSTLVKIAKVAAVIILALGVVLASAAIMGGMISTGGAGAVGGFVIVMGLGCLAGIAVSYLSKRDLGPVANAVVKVFANFKKAITKQFKPKPIQGTSLSSVQPLNALQNTSQQNNEDLVYTKAQFSNEFTEYIKWHEQIKSSTDTDQLILLDDRKVIGPKGEELNLEKKEDSGVTTYNYVNPQTNQIVYKFNEFTRDCYNGARTQDFQNRLSLSVDAAIRAVRLSEAIPDDKKLPLIIHLQNLRNNYAKMIIQEGNIDSSRKAGSMDVEFMEIFKNSKNILTTAFAETSVVLEDAGITTPLVQLEKDFVEAQGRPIIINSFKISENGPVLLNIHKPLLETTLPSSVRNKVGLSNALHNLSGYIDDNGNAVITQEAFRHSSTPPIGIPDDQERLAGAFHNSRQIIQVLAETKLGALNELPENSEDEPIPLDWNVMMLLTPKGGDFSKNLKSNLMGKGSREGETSMLEEQLESMLHWDGRPIQITLENNEKVWVQINVSGMNIGCNIPAMDVKHVRGTTAANVFLAGLPNPTITNELNAQGFMEFEIQTDDFIHAEADKYAADDQTLLTLLNEYSRLKKHYLNHKVIEIKNDYNQTLLTLRAELDACLAKGVENFNRNRIETLRTDINKIEMIKRKKIGELYNEKINCYKDPKLDELHQKIIQHLDQKINESDSDSVKKRLDVLKRVINNQRKFANSLINREYRDPKTIMVAQGIYLETMSLMDRAVSFNCKSGEDRTGIVGLTFDALGAAQVLKEHGIDDVSFDEIVCRLIDVSPGTDTNDANAIGSRGFQITDMIVPEAKKTQIAQQKKISLLAKGCVASSKQIAKMRRRIANQQKNGAYHFHDDISDEAMDPEEIT